MDGMIYETFALTENDTYTVIGSKYKFESERVISIFGTEVIPEFPTPILLLPLLLLTVLMVIFVKLRKQRQITLRNP